MKYEDIKNWEFYEPIVDTIILDAIDYCAGSNSPGHLSPARVQFLSKKGFSYAIILIEKLIELKYFSPFPKKKALITKEEFQNIINKRKPEKQKL